MSRPLVALSASSALPRGAGRPARVGVNVPYVDALQRAGLIPLIVPPTLAAEDVRTVVASVAGVVLSGGEDVDPALYGALPHPASEAPHAGRDAMELALVEAARKARTPLFGICRGLQLLNVALGGTLVQDLHSERPGPIAHACDDARPRRVHSVSVTEGTRLAEVIGDTTLDVNSLHHQAIDLLAPALHVSARAPDGVIEAAETQDGWWVLAVQWHPEELLDDAHAWDRHLFSAFARACGVR